MRPINKTRILLLLLLFSFCRNTYAQNDSLRFEHIGIEEGLSNDHVTAILQDSKGWIWFGTTDGLNKYDGYSFTKYRLDPFDSNSLSQNFIYTIWEDKYGSIWVSSFEGLCKFERSTEKFTRYKPSPKALFSDPNICSINEDNDGMMWVGSWSVGLCRFDRQTGMFLPEKFDLDGVNCICKSRDGTLWVGNSTGLHRLNLTAVTGQTSRVSITHYQHNPDNASPILYNRGHNVAA